MNYVFIAIENTDPEALRQDLLNTSDISPTSLVVEAGGTSSKFFKEFRKVAELYILTHKFWYGTYFEKYSADLPNQICRTDQIGDFCKKVNHHRLINT